MAGTVHGIMVPPGQHPPFATITPTDHAAWIIIAAALGLSLVLVFAAIRVFIRQTVSPGYGADDYLLGLASLFMLAQSIAVFVGCSKGLGKSKTLLKESQLQEVQQLYYASTVLYVIPMAASKVAVACFVLRLTPVRAHKMYIWGLMAFVAIWGLALQFSTALTCDLSHPWELIDQEKQCTGYFLRWQVLEALGAVYEAALFGSVVWLVWGLQTTRSNKTIVITTFSFRLLLVVITGLRLGSATEKDLTTDPTLLLAKFITWTSAELSYSIVSATITILRPLVNNLATHYGGGHGAPGYGYGTGSGSASQGVTLQHRSMNRTAGSSRAFPMTSITRSKNRDTELEIVEGAGGAVGTYSYGVASGRQRPTQHEAGNSDTKSVNSDSSQKIMVRKDVTWRIDEA